MYEKVRATIVIMAKKNEYFPLSLKFIIKSKLWHWSEYSCIFRNHNGICFHTGIFFFFCVVHLQM